MIFERTVKNIPVEYFLAMERNHGFPILWPSFPLRRGKTPAFRVRRKQKSQNCGASRKKKTVPKGDGFHARALRAEYCASADALKINLG